MNRYYRAVAVVAVAAAVVTCSSGPTQPVAQRGTLQLSLTTPATDDGAILFTIKGPVMGDVTRARNDLLVFSQSTGTDSLQVAVFGDGLSGSLVKLTVPDVAKISAYTVTIEQVAAANYQLRDQLGGYKLVLGP